MNHILCNGIILMKDYIILVVLQNNVVQSDQANGPNYKTKIIPTCRNLNINFTTNYRLDHDA